MCTNVIAGPPYDTDDPVPVDLGSWEFYLSSHTLYTKTAAQGSLPHIEVNYGIVKNTQLHVIVPLSISNDYYGKSNYGLGDVEVGVKYRFIEETEYRPQIGIFPLCELPSGSMAKELGSGTTQVLLPVWLQKSFGNKWQSYGGYGYWIHRGAGNRNWSYLGWQLQYQAIKSLSIGAELYYITADTKDDKNDVRCNIGSIIDVNEHNHILFSIGRSLSSTTVLQCYIGYLYTIPKHE
jgi:hypothetical protein